MKIGILSRDAGFIQPNASFKPHKIGAMVKVIDVLHCYMNVNLTNQRFITKERSLRV